MASVIERDEFTQAKDAKHRPKASDSAGDTSRYGGDATKDEGTHNAPKHGEDAAKARAAEEDDYDPAALIGWYEASGFGEPLPWGNSDPDSYALDDPKQRFVAFRDYFLAALLPIHAGNLGLTLIPEEPPDQNGGLVMEWEKRFADIPKVTMRIIRWETNEQSGQKDICDLSEQQMYTPHRAIDSFARFQALFEGWALVLHEFFAWEAKQKETVYVLPVDCFSDRILDAYDLKKAQTRDDFYIAMKAKRRLGRLFDVG